MRFHLFGDPRFPPNKEHCFDSYNSKLFRFVALFADKHQIHIYGPSTCGVHFEHPNITYHEIIDIEEYADIDIYHPNVMLAVNNDYTNIQTRFEANVRLKLLDTYQQGDIIITTASTFTFGNAIVIKYSIGSCYNNGPFVTTETKYILNNISDFKLGKCILPWFNPDDFPELDIVREPHTYLYLGRCSVVKGLSRFMLIAQYYIRNNLPGKFIVAGASISCDDPKVLRMAFNDGNGWDYDLELYSNVEYVGIVNKTERNILLRRATCLIQLSEYIEPCGYNAIEAQYCGCPVIANNYGGFLETIVDGKTGFLTSDHLSPYEPSWSVVQETLDCMKKISKINNDDCIEHVQPYFDKEHIYKETLQFFTDCINYRERVPGDLMTVHTNIDITCENSMNILEKIYYDILQYDDKFHYFWEPYLIIRTCYSEIVTSILENYNILNREGELKISWVVYSYPVMSEDTIKGDTSLIKKCAHNESISVIHNIDLYIKLFHLNSVVGITMPKEQRHAYRERAIHTLFNQNHIIGKSEVLELQAISIWRDTYNSQIGLYT